jgi:hypothetical protein
MAVAWHQPSVTVGLLVAGVLTAALPPPTAVTVGWLPALMVVMLVPSS